MKTRVTPELDKAIKNILLNIDDATKIEDKELQDIASQAKAGGNDWFRYSSEVSRLEFKYDDEENIKVKLSSVMYTKLAATLLNLKLFNANSDGQNLIIQKGSVRQIQSLALSSTAYAKCSLGSPSKTSPEKKQKKADLPVNVSADEKNPFSQEEILQVSNLRNLYEELFTGLGTKHPIWGNRPYIEKICKIFDNHGAGEYVRKKEIDRNTILRSKELIDKIKPLINLIENPENEYFAKLLNGEIKPKPIKLSEVRGEDKIVNKENLLAFVNKVNSSNSFDELKENLDRFLTAGINFQLHKSFIDAEKKKFKFDLMTFEIIEVPKVSPAHRSKLATQLKLFKAALEQCSEKDLKDLLEKMMHTANSMTRGIISGGGQSEVGKQLKQACENALLVISKIMHVSPVRQI